ncbi:hypothetical protein C7N43_26230 [Sphingobacteriales bacterium UPWRP_1]|nr:hypothetical protein B6N25_16160 [Sphingobacteriales bacterium TSM_CSS]PSJ74026.1 hypothetical protein C7N43_26230 [Sphingobacteriales bacterium UPWRP_1]
MNTQETLSQLKKLRLNGMHHTYQAMLQLPLHQQPQAHELLAQLLHAETLHRANKRTQLYPARARLCLVNCVTCKAVPFSEEQTLAIGKT